MMDYNSMTFYEVIINKIYDETFLNSQLEQYNYIKQITNNFDKMALELFVKEFNFISNSVLWDFPEIDNNGDFTASSKETNLLEFLSKLEKIFFNQKLNEVNNLIDREESISIYIKERAEFANKFVDEFSPEQKLNYIQNAIIKFDPNSEFLNRYEPFIKFAQLVNQIYEERINIKKNKGQNVTSLSFNDLFVKNFQHKLDELISTLIYYGFINPDLTWKKSIKKEPAMVYYYLSEKNVTTNLDNYKALKCFYSKFGMTVYKDLNPNDVVPNMKVCIRGLNSENCYIDSETKKNYDRIFSSLFQI